MRGLRKVICALIVCAGFWALLPQAGILTVGTATAGTATARTATAGTAMAGTAVDSLGNRITIDEKRVKVVSLSPGATEMLYAIGLRDEIVGVSDYCNYPESFVASKPRMGGFSAPNIEKIQSVKPDIIFLNTVVPIFAKNQFERLSIQLFVAEPSSFDELISLIIESGKLFGREKEARALASQMKLEAEKIADRLRAGGRRPVRTFVEVWYKPYYAAEKSSLPGDIVRLAGGEVVPDTGSAFSLIGEELILSLNPEAIVLGHNADYETFIQTHRNLEDVEALRNGKVYTPDPDEFLRPGPRVVKALNEIARFLHPEAF